MPEPAGSPLWGHRNGINVAFPRNYQYPVSSRKSRMNPVHHPEMVRFGPLVRPAAALPWVIAPMPGQHTCPRPPVAVTPGAEVHYAFPSRLRDRVGTERARSAIAVARERTVGQRRSKNFAGFRQIHRNRRALRRISAIHLIAGQRGRRGGRSRHAAVDRSALTAVARRSGGPLIPWHSGRTYHDSTGPLTRRQPLSPLNKSLNPAFVVFFELTEKARLGSVRAGVRRNR
jgi:hypothetical protein